ncbi:hypothetical protein VitviT2T_004251 [Vitis vinifera]|uniref:Uncharacterized protein n=1 Tax=Vitis vinifera TaxID=29760 RepID=A0ABY9BNX4_VITVI|nr:hypothetical protein VitviT2T_004251 [Vitis vinifera]
MFNALSEMGGGGQVDAAAANNANTALYTTFAIFDVLGGGIYNILGPRFTLFAGCSTYVLYTGSFLYYNHYRHQGFAIVTGAILEIEERGCVHERRYLHWVHVLHVRRHRPHAGDPAPSHVVQDDDSHYTKIKYSDVSTEAVEILKLFRNWKMLLMVPTNPPHPENTFGTGMGSH